MFGVKKLTVGWWLVGRLTFPFSKKTGYIRDSNVLGEDVVPPGYG